MKFYLPIIILLTMLSPNLEAETIGPDITALPYALDLRLFNVDSGLASISWEGTEVDFTAYNPATGAFSGTIDWMANGSEWVTREFSGMLNADKTVRVTTVFPFIGTVWIGAFNEDLQFAGGRLDGIGTSDMTGIWTLTAVDIPPAGLLFIGAMGTLMLLHKRKGAKR